MSIPLEPPQALLSHRYRHLLAKGFEGVLQLQIVYVRVDHRLFMGYMARGESRASQTINPGCYRSLSSRVMRDTTRFVDRYFYE